MVVPSQSPLASADDLSFLRELTLRTLARCRTEVTIDGTPYPAYMASGSRQYPAFWTRDAVWVVASGLLQAEDIEPMLEILARTQNGPEPRHLRNGLVIPAWAAPDHVLCENGGAVFFPGTYESGGDQGDGRYGRRAAQDACYMFVELAHQFLLHAGSTSLFNERVAGVPLFERLKLAFESPEHDAETGLAVTSAATRAVAFSDAIVKTGILLDGSILRWRAALRLADIASALRLPEQSALYRGIADRIRDALPDALWHATGDDEGWLLSASAIGRQDCVRGTSFALALGILETHHAEEASRALARASSEPSLAAVPGAGQVTYQGHVRHLSSGEYWDDTPMKAETYQNGGYWGMFTGWFARGLAVADPALAEKTARVFIEHMRQYSAFDGIGSTDQGAPWEWIHPNGTRVGPLYAPTVALAYRGFAEGFRADFAWTPG